MEIKSGAVVLVTNHHGYQQKHVGVVVGDMMTQTEPAITYEDHFFVEITPLPHGEYYIFDGRDKLEIMVHKDYLKVIGRVI